MATIRLLLTLAIQRQWKIQQLDIFNAFLHGDLSDDIYMRQPPGFIDPNLPDHEHYANKLLKDIGFTDCKAAPTPLALNNTHKTNPAKPFADPSLYRRLAGALQYLTITRPDIAFATNRICQQMHRPTDQDYQDLKQILRYIKGTISFGLPFIPGDLTLRTFTDADWALDHTDRKSVSGFCTFLGPNLISWTVKK
ncbi:uncharacterized protein LOC110092980 [Dendrobium catenatum]|uniref:uncharacterized protein LOC110092980 n=1 Tax=Dendrobium catenatum TaxID=906689 RepID=UPI0009F50BC0|nr:uncharacterized protein LOC110092980 [Dendrobium catenatum]